MYRMVPLNFRKSISRTMWWVNSLSYFYILVYPGIHHDLFSLALVISIILFMQHWLWVCHVLQHRFWSVLRKKCIVIICCNGKYLTSMSLISVSVCISIMYFLIHFDFVDSIQHLYRMKALHQCKHLGKFWYHI